MASRIFATIVTITAVILLLGPPSAKAQPKTSQTAAITESEAESANKNAPIAEQPQLAGPLSDISDVVTEEKKAASLKSTSATSSTVKDGSGAAGGKDFIKKDENAPEKLLTKNNAEQPQPAPVNSVNPPSGITEIEIPTASPDPVLLEIENQLRQLVRGTLSEDTDVQVLFDVPLEDSDAVTARISALQEEYELQRALKVEKQKRRKNLAIDFPPPLKPESLNTLPVAPTAPVAPEPPENPDVRRPKGTPSPNRSEKWRAAYDAWQQFDEKQAVFSAAMIQYEQASEDFRTAQSAYDTAVEKFETVEHEYEKALEMHAKKNRERDLSLQQDIEIIDLRVRILSLRQKYLRALQNWMEPITAPARTALTGLKQQRKSIGTAIGVSQRFARALTTLSTQLQEVANRSDAGSISGFQIKLSQLAVELRQIADAVIQRSEKLTVEQEALIQLQRSLQRQSNDVRHLIFANVLNPKRDQLVDAAFLKYLNEMRKASKAWFTTDVNMTNINAVIADIEKLNSNSGDVTTYSEATLLVSETKALLEKCDAQTDAFGVLREHQKQIFRREAVAILSGLATAQTRKRAYSFSQEILADLGSDFYSLKNAVASWATQRKEAVLALPSTVKTRDGILLILRLFAAITLLILIGLLGRKLGMFVTIGIRRLSKSRLFRYRPGQLLRYAGLAEALLPTVLIGATLYGAFAIVGFSVPEMRFAEVILRWTILYKLGEKLLTGLTRRVSRGRPAFIKTSTEIAAMLLNTYRKLGRVSALAAILLEWSSQWFGSGTLNALVVNLLWGWLFIWGAWALFIWRPALADSLADRYIPPVDAPGKRRLHKLIFRISQWMKTHRTGAILTAPAMIILLLDKAFREVRYLLYEGGIVTFFRARLIRRLVNTRKRNSVIPSIRSLPERYTSAFPLYPIYHEENAVILPRQKSVAEIAQQIEKWRITRQDSSLVLLGEKGVGKTTLLSLLEMELSGNVHRYSIGQKLKSEKALVAELATAFGIEDCAPVVGAVASFLNQGDERVVLIDECHNIFLRTIDGYDAYEAFIRLVNVTSQNVFWVLVFNSFSFAFLNASKRRLHYFRKLHTLPTWTRDDLFELISKRNRQSGFEIEFDEVLLDANRSATGDFEVIEGADGFFRLLWENSGGNPRVATCLWLDSLTAAGENKIRVGIFSETLATELSKLDVELLYTLAAICQHENLSVSEVRDVLNVSSDFANFAIRFLTEYGLVEHKHTDTRRHTLAPKFYPQVIKLLRGHHLLYEKE